MQVAIYIFHKTFRKKIIFQTEVTIMNLYLCYSFTVNQKVYRIATLNFIYDDFTN